jgi:SagB-type dehydrogenase family enzyme
MLTYHQRSKHFPFRFAPSLGYMDWETQPDPFRRFEGVRTFPLGFEPVGPLPRYEPAFVLGQVNPAPLHVATVARLFYDALALSAWKEILNASWSLRVNPSSGNPHPTEGYLVGGPLPSLHDKPAVYHYAPLVHTLELRVELSTEVWRAISAQLPKNAFLVGLTSNHWRQSWKYGERAFRYCHHDVGHAIACVSVAAAGLGWDTRLLEGVVDEDLATLLGAHLQTGIEAEHPDCLIAVFPQSTCLEAEMQQSFRLETDLVTALRAARWMGRSNTLSQDHHDWPAIDEVAAATEKHEPPGDDFWSPFSHRNDSLELRDLPLSLRSMIHQRRSAVGLDGSTGIKREAFYQILLKATPGSNQIPFTTLPWRPCVDLLLFVHRVEDLPPGLYVLLRDPARKNALRNSMEPCFWWRRPDGCPSSLPLFFLVGGTSAAQPSRRAVTRRSRRTVHLPLQCSPSIASLSRTSVPGSTAGCTGRRVSLASSSTSRRRQPGFAARGSGAISTTLPIASSGLRAIASRRSTTSRWEGRLTTHACKPIHPINTSFATLGRARRRRSRKSWRTE